MGGSERGVGLVPGCSRASGSPRPGWDCRFGPRPDPDSANGIFGAESTLIKSLFVPTWKRKSIPSLGLFGHCRARKRVFPCTCKVHCRRAACLMTLETVSRSSASLKAKNLATELFERIVRHRIASDFPTRQSRDYLTVYRGSPRPMSHSVKVAFSTGDGSANTNKSLFTKLVRSGMLRTWSAAYLTHCMQPFRAALS